MEIKDRKTVLSQKYIEVMATLSGHQTIADPLYPSIIRIRELIGRKLPKGRHTHIFSNREIKGYILPYSENQVKPGKGIQKFSVDLDLYNTILETASHQRPTVLFICSWPSDQNGPVIFSKEALSMICTCYWFIPSKKSKLSSSTKSVNIEIPDEQIIDANAFEKILAEIYV